MSAARVSTKSALADRAFVRFCVGDGRDISAAWAAWMKAAEGLRAWDEGRYPSHWRDLLPLAAYRQRKALLEGPAWLISRLRTAAVLEERRLAAVHETTAAILSLPELAPCDPLVIGGLGIGETAYPAPATRHTGALTMMLADGTRLRPLMRKLLSRNYRVRRAGLFSWHLPGNIFARVWLMHPTGFNVQLLSASGRRPLSHTELMKRAQGLRVGDGLAFQAPAPAEALALIDNGVGAERGLDSLVPQVDAALLRRLIAGGVEAPVRGPAGARAEEHILQAEAERPELRGGNYMWRSGRSNVRSA
jgi:hypothetical protein